MAIACLPGDSYGKESACDAGGPGSTPGSGRSPGEGNGNLLQDSCLENPMDGETCWATFHGASKSRTRLSDFTSLQSVYTWASLVAQRLKRLPAIQETWVRSLVWEDSPGEGNGNPLQDSCLENYTDCTVHVVAKSQTCLSDFHFTSLHAEYIM